MARKSYGRASSLINIGTYADDPAYPIGSGEWNSNHSDDGVIGFDKSAQAIASANTINVTDSFIEITTADSASGGSNDGIRTLAAITTAHSATNYPTDTSNSNVKLRSNASSYSEGDLIYVVKAAGQATTSLVHQGGGAGAGKITTLTGSNKELSATVPTILMARIISGNVEWVEYGGGAVTVPTTITVTDESSDTTCFPLFVDTATGDRAPKTGSNFLFNADTGLLTLTGELNAASLDISGNVDVDGTLETDALTINGTTLAATIVATKIDDLTAGDDNTDIDASSARHGLFAKLDKVKIDTIETSATADQTGGEIKTAYEAESDTNAFTDAKNAILSATAGTVTASKAVITDASNNLTGFGNVTIGGNLTVSGTTTTLDVTNLSVEDPLIQLAKANAGADTLDIGFWGLYDTSGSTELRAGLFRDATDGKWRLFKDTQEDLTSLTAINTSGTGYAVATLVANIEGNITGALTGNASGTALTVTQPAQVAITSVGELTGLTMSSATSHIDLDGANINNGGVVFLKEQASADSSQAALGQIWVDDSAPNRLFFTDDAGTDFDLTAGGGATLLHTFSNSTTTSSSQTGIAFAAGTAVGTQASGAGDRDIYVRKIDTNNEGVFALIHKNGAIVEAQLA